MNQSGYRSSFEPVFMQSFYLVMPAIRSNNSWRASAPERLSRNPVCSSRTSFVGPLRTSRCSMPLTLPPDNIFIRRFARA
jgi:hypothetical protein